MAKRLKRLCPRIGFSMQNTKYPLSSLISCYSKRVKLIFRTQNELTNFTKQTHHLIYSNSTKDTWKLYFLHRPLNKDLINIKECGVLKNDGDIVKLK